LVSGDARQPTINREEIERYKRLLTEIKGRGMKTFVTLFHFCLPLWLARVGGWHSDVVVQEFRAFTEIMVKEFGDLVDYWITINEPLAYAYQSYIAGSWPPGLMQDFPYAFKCVRNMIEAHGACYKVIHEHSPTAQVSFTMHWRPFTPKNELNPLDQMVAFYRNTVFNHLFPKTCDTGILEFPPPFGTSDLVKSISGPIPDAKDSMDYLALNYYTRDICEFKPGLPIDFFGVRTEIDQKLTNAMGWESYPDGLYNILANELSRYKRDGQGRIRPIMITENGYADVYPAELSEGDWSLNDEARTEYLHTHLLAVHRAIKSGANVQGYLHWSLLDNFEWAEGLRIRFGLVRVAFPTQERTMRKSAAFYSEVAKKNGVDNSIPYNF
jgi:beta-glucosidase